MSRSWMFHNSLLHESIKIVLYLYLEHFVWKILNILKMLIFTFFRTYACVNRKFTILERKNGLVFCPILYWDMFSFFFFENIVGNFKIVHKTCSILVWDAVPPLKQLSIWIPQSSSIHPSIFPFILTFAASPSPNLTILSYKLYRSLCVKVNRMLQLFYARHISVCLCTVCNFIQCSFTQLWCSLTSSLCVGRRLPIIVFHNKFAHCEYLSA